MLELTSDRQQNITTLLASSVVLRCLVCCSAKQEFSKIFAQSKLARSRVGGSNQVAASNVLKALIDNDLINNVSTTADINYKVTDECLQLVRDRLGPFPCTGLEQLENFADHVLYTVASEGTAISNIKFLKNLPQGVVLYKFLEELRDNGLIEIKIPHKKISTEGAHVIKVTEYGRALYKFMANQRQISPVNQPNTIEDIAQMANAHLADGADADTLATWQQTVGGRNIGGWAATTEDTDPPAPRTH